VIIKAVNPKHQVAGAKYNYLSHSVIMKTKDICLHTELNVTAKP